MNGSYAVKYDVNKRLKEIEKLFHTYRLEDTLKKHLPSSNTVVGYEEKGSKLILKCEGSICKVEKDLFWNDKHWKTLIEGALTSKIEALQSDLEEVDKELVVLKKSRKKINKNITKLGKLKQTLWEE